MKVSGLRLIRFVMVALLVAIATSVFTSTSMAYGGNPLVTIMSQDRANPKGFPPGTPDADIHRVIDQLQEQLERMRPPPPPGPTLGEIAKIFCRRLTPPILFMFVPPREKTCYEKVMAGGV